MKKLLIIIVCAITGMTTNLNAQNHSIQLNGVSDFVNIGTASNGARSIELWFKPGVTVNPTLISLKVLIGRNAGGREFGLAFSPDAGHQGELMFFNRDIGGVLNKVYSVGSNTWTAGTWYHATVVIDPTTGTTLYVNGAAVGTGTSTAAALSSGGITAIGRFGSLTTASYHFNGRIENVRLWNIALNPLSEVIPNRCNTPLTTVGLIAEYLFNEGVGAVANDFMGAFPGVVTGSTWPIDCPCDIVMQFDGVNDNVNLGADVGDGVRSIEMWFRPRTTINAGSPITTLIARNDAFEWEEFGLYFSGGQLFFFTRLANNLQQVPSGFATWNAGTWYHVTATIEAPGAPGGIHPGMNLYVNGIHLGNNPLRTAAVTTTTEITALGCWGDANIRFFDGQIENVRLWSRELIQNPAIPVDEPLNNMCNLPFNYIGINAEYRLNEHHGNVLTDQFGVAIDGIVGGGVTQPVRRWVEGNPCNIGSGWDRLANTETVININESEIKIYPNPSTGSFLVDVGTDENTLIEIYDITGRKVKSLESISQNVVEIDLSNEQKGVYFVRILNGEKMHSSKVLIH